MPNKPSTVTISYQVIADFVRVRAGIGIEDEIANREEREFNDWLYDEESPTGLFEERTFEELRSEIQRITYGKTRTLIAVIEKRASKLLSQENVIYFHPTDLAGFRRSNNLTSDLQQYLAAEAARRGDALFLEQRKAKR